MTIVCNISCNFNVNVTASLARYIYKCVCVYIYFFWVLARLCFFNMPLELRNASTKCWKYLVYFLTMYTCTLSLYEILHLMRARRLQSRAFCILCPSSLFTPSQCIMSLFYSGIIYIHWRSVESFVWCKSKEYTFLSLSSLPQHKNKNFKSWRKKKYSFRVWKCVASMITYVNVVSLYLKKKREK